MEDLGLIPGLGRSPGEGKDHPLQYSGLEKSMHCIVLGVAKGWTRLSNFLLVFVAPANLCLFISSQPVILGRGISGETEPLRELI